MNEKTAAEQNFGETEAAKTILFAEFHEEIEELVKKISSLENKIDTIEWKVDPRSDPSFWKEPNDDLQETDNKYFEMEPINEEIFSKNESLIRPSYLPQSECPELNEPVDAVYTWVNGSDPEFLRSLEETDLGLETHSLDTSPQRYQGLLHSWSSFIL